MTKKTDKVRDGKYILLLPLLSFGLLSVTFLWRGAFWLSLIGLLPFVFFCANANKYSNKQVRGAVFWPGFIYGLAIYLWELQTSPSSWTALSGWMSTLSKVLAWLVSAAIISVGFWLLARFVAHFREQTTFLLISLPVVWGLAEFFRTLTFAVVSYGPGASLSPNWNLGLIGLGLTSTPLVFLARFVGLYGMSMVAVVINIALFLAIFKKQYRPAAIIMTPLLLFSCLGYALYNPNGRQLPVAAVHLESKDSLDSWSPAPLPSKDRQLLVIPEYSLFFQNKDYKDFARQHFGPQTTLITSVSTNDKPSKNELIMYRIDGGIINQQPKTFLIAGGEYMPYLFSSFFNITNQSYLTKSFNDSQQVKRGSSPEQAVQLSSLKTGSLVCSGVLALNEYRRLANEGAEVFTNSASLSLIASASLYHVQEGYLTRFHAIANARPFIQASRSGESYIMTSDGLHLADASGNTQLLETTVQTSTKKTLYTLAGEWTLIAGPITLVFLRRRFS